MMSSPTSPPISDNDSQTSPKTVIYESPERNRIARRLSRKSIANPEDRISGVSYYTSGTDRTSQYTTASEYDSASEYPTIDPRYIPSVEVYAITSRSITNEVDIDTNDVDDNHREEAHEEPVAPALSMEGKHIIQPSVDTEPLQYGLKRFMIPDHTSTPWLPAQQKKFPEIGGEDKQQIGESYLNYDAHYRDENSISGGASAVSFPQYNEKHNAHNVDDTLYDNVAFMSRIPPQDLGNHSESFVMPSDSGLMKYLSSSHTDAALSPNTFATSPLTLKSRYNAIHSEYRSTPPKAYGHDNALSLASNGAISTQPVLPSTTFLTRNPGTSYTRGPNPPITTVTRNRHKGGGTGSNFGGYVVRGHGKPSGSSTSVSSITHGGTMSAHSEWERNNSGEDIHRPDLAEIIPQLGGASSSMYENAGNISSPPSSTRESPLTPQRKQHKRDFSSSSSMTVLPATNASGTGFGTAPLSPSGHQSRPGTSASTERETFSSPPVYVPPFSPRGSMHPWGSGVGGWGGGDSGSSTPRDTSFERSRNTSTIGLNNTIITQHVPGLGGTRSFKGSTSIDGTPCDMVALSRPFTPTIGNPFCGEDPFNGPSQGRLGIRTKSTVVHGEVEKPWLQKKNWRDGASWWISFGMIMVGVATSAYACFKAWNSVMLIDQPLCLVMQDDFDTFDVDHDGANWRHEVDMSGFGNGEFEMTTNSLNNSFVSDGKLYIVPTLTELSIGRDNVFDGYVYNITDCTDTEISSACGAVSNKTTRTVINPVMSARITTQKSHSIRYGRVEIRAKLPKGDWLWPALWMLPVNNAYGPWPLSGEIDIMESRGNSPRYPHDGNNVVRGTLNWGPLSSLNAAYLTFGTFADRRKSFSDDFHIYALEWTPKFIRTYVDSRLLQTLQLAFDKPFFTRGKFPAVVQNGSETVAVQNPWFGRPNSAPFDQPFFLIMNVAVGGTNGWFPDGIGNKPWVDASQSAMYDFAMARDTWYPTWPEDPRERAMVVDYVKMWELC